MKSSEDINIKFKQECTSSNKMKRRKKLKTISLANKSQNLSSSPCENYVNENKNKSTSKSKLGLPISNKTALENHENNKQIESANAVKKRGRKSNRDKLQLNLGRNQSDLQTFVQREAKQSKELESGVDVLHASIDEEGNSFSENCIKSRKNYKRKKVRSPQDIRDVVYILNSSPNGSVKDNTEEDVITEQKNAFKVMMESRNKVIGRNSPGKDPEMLEVDTGVGESKLKLSARKSLLQEWADAKGGLKRKFNEAEKQLCINEKLEMRAKRMKNMLSLSLSNKTKDGGVSSKRRKSKKIISDSESSPDEEALKVIHISEDSEDPRSDTEKQCNVIKIKMFSPDVFKRRRRNLQNISKEIIDSKTNNRYKTTGEDHKNRDTINAVQEIINNKETNMKQSLRMTTNVNYSCSDMMSLSSDTEDSSDSYTLNKPKIKESKKLKEMKVAPVFLRATPKPKVDPIVIEARKRFLMSGVPDSLKIVIEKQQTLDDVEYAAFPNVSHVQQKTSYEHKNIDYWSLSPANLCYAENDVFTPNLREVGSLSLLNYVCDDQKQPTTNSITETKNLKSILKEIKSKCPNFPVFRTFRLLREKFELCREALCTKKTSIRKKKNQKRKSQQLDDKRNKNMNDYILWTEKFKAKTSNDVVGNHDSILKLKKWLISWVEYTRETRLHVAKNSSSSEFYSSDGECSGSGKIPSNAVILVGPPGSGKTMSIYAICEELQINVLELNASDKRTGKRLLQKLQEATQSHQVRKNGSTYTSQNDLDWQVKKERMCLLVVDDIDVVFDEDEGFLSALAQLLLTSKRPIVLVTTDENCSHLSKFITQYPVIKFAALSANVLSVWLQILCLIEGIKIDDAMAAELLEWNKGDARQTLLQLQFWMQSTDRKPLALKNCTGRSDVINLSSDENISHLGELPDSDLQQVAIYSNHRQFFVNETLTLGNMWWNLSSLLNISPISHDFSTSNDPAEDKSEEFYKLQKCVEVFDTFAISDFIYTKLNLDGSTEPCPKFFQENIVKDSMELGEDMNTYNGCNEFARDWTDYLLSKQLGMHVESQIKTTCLTSQERRWRSKQYNCEKNFLELIPPSYHSDRKAFSLDYFPTLRTVARSEKHRFTTNCKRRNRFYNYLCTLGFSQRDAISETACGILNISEGSKQ